MNLDHIISKKLFNLNDLVAVYPYGSRVYGTATKNSDYDYIVIVKKKDREQYSDSLININFYTPEEHQQRLIDHEISALECFFLPKEMILFDCNHPLNRSNIGFSFNLDVNKLRHSLSAKSSNSWVKAKKKLTVEKDLDMNLGRKSMFHAFRIIDFGIQIAEQKSIYDYRSCNVLFHEIAHCYTWGDMFLKFKTRYNNTLSKFRTVAPK